jgi:N-succinyldiaminopimelate aminotransferase
VNPRLQRLEAYPFERMNALKAGSEGNPEHPHLALSIGEPKHPPPPFIVDAFCEPELLAKDLATYPATRGSDALREAIADWLRLRFQVSVDPATEVLPVSGTREALFSFAQAVLGSKPDPIGILPNPFYQIYEGAIHLAGGEPYFVNTTREHGFLPDYRSVPDAIWSRCELLYLCSPGNPTGACLDTSTLSFLIEQAERFDFVIAADECYSEIYLDEDNPPPGLLQVAASMGQASHQRCVVFHSLSKRSNLPGLRSGFVAGDAGILADYFQYRTYEGCALPAQVQRVSALAWSDEDHVLENRRLYRQKFDAVAPRLAERFPVYAPDGGFYHWLDVGGDDQAFTLDLYRQENITVLPGSFLSRTAHGINPGRGYVRVAWVAPMSDCLDAAERLVRFAAGRKKDSGSRVAR